MGISIKKFIEKINSINPEPNSKLWISALLLANDLAQNDSKEEIIIECCKIAAKTLSSKYKINQLTKEADIYQQICNLKAPYSWKIKEKAIEENITYFRKNHNNTLGEIVKTQQKKLLSCLSLTIEELKSLNLVFYKDLTEQTLRELSNISGENKIPITEMTLLTIQNHEDKLRKIYDQEEIKIKIDKNQVILELINSLMTDFSNKISYYMVQNIEIPKYEKDKLTRNQYVEPIYNAIEHSKMNIINNNMIMWDYLKLEDLIRKDNNNYIIINSSGFGKTTFLKHLAIDILNISSESNCFPIYIRANDLIADQDIIMKSINIDYKNKESFIINEDFSNLVILLDGLDQCQDLQKILNIINDSDSRRRNFKNSKLLITSRENSAKLLLTKNTFTLLRLQPPSENEIFKYFGGEDKLNDYQKLLLTSIITKSPLFLELLKGLFLSPSSIDINNSSDLFKIFIEKLLKEETIKIQTERKLRNEERILRDFIPHHVLRILEEIAYYSLISNQMVQIEYKYIKQSIKSFSIEEENTLLNLGIIIELDERTFEFRHQAFQAYFAAKYIKKNKPDEIITILNNKLYTQSDIWKEVIVLYIALETDLKEKGKLINNILELSEYQFFPFIKESFALYCIYASIFNEIERKKAADVVINRILSNENRLVILRKILIDLFDTSIIQYFLDIIATKYSELDLKDENYLITGYSNINKQAIHEAIKCFEDALSVNKNSIEAKFALAYAYLLNKEFENAHTIYNSIIEDDRNNLQAYFEIATILEIEEKFDESLNYLKIAESISPNNTIFLNALASISDKQGNIEKAVEYYLKSLSINNRDYFVNQWLSNLYRKINQYDKSIEINQNLIKLFPFYDDPYINLGDDFIHKSNNKEAIKNFKQAISINPNNIRAYVGLGIAYRNTGEKILSLQCFEQARLINPNEPKIYINIGLTYQFLSNNNMDELEIAIKYFNIARDLAPNDLLAYKCLAKIFQELNDYDKAIEYYNTILEKDPNNYNICQSLGLLYKIINKYSESIEAYTRANNINNYPEYYLDIAKVYYEKEDYNKAIEYGLEAISKTPENDSAYLFLGLSYGEVNEWTKSIEYLKKSINLNPNIKEKYFDLAKAFKHNKELHDSIKYFDLFLQYNPNSFDAHINLGLIYHDQNKYDKAIEHYEKAYSIDENDLELLNRIADCYLQLNNYDLTIRKFKEIVSKESNNPQNYWNLGYSYLRFGNYNEAIINFDHYLNLKPNEEIALSSIAFSHLMNKSPDKAIEYCKKALEKNPHDLNNYQMLGLAYENNLNFDKAIDLYFKALEKHPNNVDLIFQLGNIYFQSGDLDKSVIYLNKVLDLGMNSAKLYQTLGKINLLKNNNIESIDYHLKSIDFEPDNQELRYDLAIAYSYNNEHDKAISILEDINKKIPKNTSCLQALSAIYIMNNQINDSINVNNQLIETYPNFITTYINQALALNSIDKELEGYEILEKAISINSIETLDMVYNMLDGLSEKDKYYIAKFFNEYLAQDLPNYRFLIVKGWINVLINDYDKALKNFTKAENIDNNNAEVKYYLGLVYFHNSEIKKCTKSLLKAYKIDKINPLIPLKLGQTYIKLNNNPRIIYFFNKLLEANQYNLYSLVNIGMALNNLKAYEEAIKYFKQAKIINPDDKVNEENLRLAINQAKKQNKILKAYYKLKIKLLCLITRITLFFELR